MWSNPHSILNWVVHVLVKNGACANADGGICPNPDWPMCEWKTIPEEEVEDVCKDCWRQCLKYLLEKENA